MKAAIYTKWRRSDPTFAAISVATLFERMGCDFEIIPAWWRTKTVDMRWDHKVSKVPEDSAKLLGQLKTKQLLVWTEPPPPNFVSWLIFHRIPIINVLYTAWDSVSKEDEMAVGIMDHVFVPTDLQADVLRKRWSHPRVAAVPYNCWLPPVLKHKFHQRGELHLFLSTFGNQLHRMDLNAIAAIVEVMQRNKYVHCTIAGSRGMSRRVTWAFRALIRSMSPRMKYYDDCPWHEQQVLMSHADLTVWPACVDGHGIIPRTSLCLGTPVIGFNFHPANVYVRDQINGMLTKCGVTHSRYGADIAEPDWTDFEVGLEYLVTHPDVLSRFALASRFDSEACHKLFVDRWQAIMPV
jgi:hypothetical protein